MSPEEIERTVQFLLHSQARFDANFEKLALKVDRISEGLIGLMGMVGRVNEDVEQLAGQVGQVTGQVGQLTGQVGQLTEAQRRTDQQIRDLGEYVREMFDGHLRDDHGRRPS